MMHKRRSLLLSTVCVVSALLGVAVIGDAQNAGKKVPPVGKEAVKRALARQAIVRLLQEPFETQSFNEPQLKIRDFVALTNHLINQRFGDLPIFLDYQAFKEMKDELTEDEFYSTEIRIPQEAKRLPLGTILRIAVSRLPPNGGTWIVRNGMIQITTLDKASPVALMRTEFDVVFDQHPLQIALQELSDRTGVDIVLDPRVGSKSETKISATFGNGVPLKTAVSLLADVTGLKMVELPGALYLTTPENAVELRQEQKNRQEEEIWRRDNNLPEINPPPQRPGADAGA
jgi:hypothetical protein